MEEIPAYPLSGEGEHLFLWIQKKSRNTTDVVKAVARAANLRERDIGYAGMKDKNAITRQWLSLCSKEEDPKSWDLGPGIEILATNRHGNKLRTGHLIGNRFDITLVDTEPNGLESARSIFDFMAERGIPNYFGAQRFGYGGRNLAQALTWLRESSDGSPEPDRANRKRPGKKGRFENKLLPSVVQSEVFNRYVAARLVIDRPLLEGEVVRLDGTGKCFVVEDVEKEMSRFLEKDLHLTGPMIGPKGLSAQHAALALEHSITQQVGLDETALNFLGRHAPGTRRDVMLYPENLEVGVGEGGAISVSFSLPAGAYATGVIRELTGVDFFAPRPTEGL